MKIGQLEVHNPLLLAPMAGITDNPFRLICREMGAGVVYTEFVSANGIIRENMKTLNLMNFTESERPIGIQIFGEEPKIVGDSSKMIGKIIDGYNVFKYDQVPEYENAYGICGLMDPVVKKKLLTHRLKKIITKYQI